MSVNSQPPYYFDYAASTPVDPEVVEAIQLALSDYWANPSAKTHRYGWEAGQFIQQQRICLAEMLNCQPQELVWTSGATEANNLALQGVLSHLCSSQSADSAKTCEPIHVVSSQVEHKAVLEVLQALEKKGSLKKSIEVSYLRPEPDKGGAVSVDAVRAAIRPNTRLVTLMQVNNELGGISDIQKISRALKKETKPDSSVSRHQNPIILHVDAAQSLGKIEVNLLAMGADMVSLSAHKAYGPKGIGALFIRRPLKPMIQPLLFGGEQEGGLRPGTLPSHQIVGFVKAVELIKREFLEELNRVTVLSDRLHLGLNQIDGIKVHSGCNREFQVPHIVNFRLNKPLHNPDALLLGLTDLAVGTGSACNSETLTPSHVLQAMGIPDEEALTSIRLSLGRYTTKMQIERCLAQISEVVSALI